MHRSRFTCAVVLILVLGTAMTMTSCGGGAGGTNPDLVLLGFNVPNLSGIALNQPLIFTFSANINPSTITPDSLRVVGTAGPFFEATVVDGNLVALLPTTPNFADYSDAGLQPDIEYTVSLTEFPAVTTIETTSGKPLLSAESFTFKTTPTKSSDIVSNISCNGPDGILGTPDDDTPGSPSFFVEPRRSIRHGVPWTLGGRSDDDGCLQNADAGNALYVSPGIDPSALQEGSGPGARLVCLQNAGSPRVIEALSVPRHNAAAIGSPSATQPGLIDLPAIRVKLNEPLDPLTVEPFFAGIPVNVQLWRVALKNGDFTGPDQIATNKPIVVQSISDTEIILVPAGPVPQGVYLINLSPAVKDLPGCPLRINDRPNPALHGYDVYEAMGAFSAAISPGYRIYFRTLEVPDTPLAIIEDFNNNLAEWGDNDSGQGGNMFEPGIYTRSISDGAGTPGTFDGDPLADTGGTATPATERVYGGLGAIDGDADGALGGQSTTAIWNGGGTVTPGGPITDADGYRFLNIPTLFPNPNVTNPNAGALKAVHQPWAGNGLDGVFDSNGANTGWDTDAGSVDGDGIFQVRSFHLRAGDELVVTGSKPLLVLCQGDFIVEGTMRLDGAPGGHGFDTDGSAKYVNAGAVNAFGAGGAGGPGGGAGGAGANPVGTSVNGVAGGSAATLFDAIAVAGGAGATANSDAGGTNVGSSGGAGGGFGTSGADGTTSDGTVLAIGGPTFGDFVFLRALALFNPDRGYFNNSNISGGNGGGGGSLDDDLNGGGSEAGEGGSTANGDDGGAGGGGGGGGLWVLARGAVSVAAGGILSCDGGAGGNTYGLANQTQDPGEDGDGMTEADNVFTGLVASPGAPDGDGGPGGGGSGGGIFLHSHTSMTIAAGATVTANGGAGGLSGDAARSGGAGAAGRILLATSGAAAAPTTAGATISPAPLAAPGYPLTQNLASVGQSDWVDLFTTNTEFAPVVGGVPQVPTFLANFTLDAGNPGFLELPTGSGGGGQTAGTDFDAKFEFQGADFINDGDGNTADALDSTPTEADGLTLWVDASMITAINTKRFVRWRWRFFAKEGYGMGGSDPADLQLPTVFEVTIPFVKN